VNVECPDLTDYLAIAAEVTGTDLKTIADATKLDLGLGASCAFSQLRGPGVLP
jgi:hypothetical protein